MPTQWMAGLYFGRGCHTRPRVSGRELCRDQLVGGEYVFRTLTSLLVRSNQNRKHSLFFNEQNLHADEEAWFDILLEPDFGFID